MSLLSSFIKNQLVKALEDEFLSHSAELQQAFVNEVEAFAGEILSWIKEKIESTNPTE